jgi:hypothetical protein
MQNGLLPPYIVCENFMVMYGPDFLRLRDFPDGSPLYP